MVIMVIKLKEMHFKNVDQWTHASYKKILNMFTMLKNVSCEYGQ